MSKCDKDNCGCQCHDDTQAYIITDGPTKLNRDHLIKALQRIRNDIKGNCYFGNHNYLYHI